MLVDLKIQNFALIDDITVNFGPGLNILSGETGAGKSVLLKGLALLMGQKADSSFVKSGCNEAIVEGTFNLRTRADIIEQLNELGIAPDEDQLIIRRIIQSEGSNKVFMNDSRSPLATLKKIVAPLVEVAGSASPLIEMTGQHESRNLLSKSYHLEMLDRCSGLDQDCKEVRKDYDIYTGILQNINEITALSQEREQKLDFLYFQRDEIEKMNLQPGDEEQIELAATKVKNLNRINDFFDFSEASLFENENSVLTSLQRIEKSAHDLSTIDSGIKPISEILSQASSLIDELKYEFRSARDKLTDSELDKESIEERLSQFRKIQKKYGETAEDILQHFEHVKNEIADLEKSGHDLSTLIDQCDEVRELLHKKSLALHTKRINSAKKFEKNINNVLKDLNMKGLTFIVQVNELDEVNRTGLSEIEFLVQAAKSQPARPLAKTASGGEMSRILLAIKSVAGPTSHPRTYLFDEVDTGVSGKTAEKVGLKLKSIGKGQQVICVTHLPQVAAYSDHHYLIEKTPHRDSYQMQITKLDSQNLVNEIARLISGEKISASSLKHAKQLLKESHATH